MIHYKFLHIISSRSLSAFVVGVAFFVAACSDIPPRERALFQRLDSTQTGIGFSNTLKDEGAFNILDYLYFYNGAGVAAGDVNNDGWTDLFFVSNQGKNKLYLNQGSKTPGGGFHFEDISASAGIEGFSDWKTGVTMADVNGDGWLDIYVCAVGNFKGLEGSNELYINNGRGIDGNVTFSEKAAVYGLDFTGFSTQAAFFDYDKDGDLDMYLVNHAVHTSRSYNIVSTRDLRDNAAGDYLFQNQLVTTDSIISQSGIPKFTDVSKQAGIYQAAMGYGLGIAVADFNNDQWNDIYVSNDFHEDDYYYINNHDGTFSESVKKHFRHLSRFSMGCDAADLNNDGYQDLMTLDMYPQEEVIEKSSLGEDPLDIFNYKLQFGYFYQYSRNCLQMNLSGDKFFDVAAMAGVAATDWSWSTLLADYDNDGIKDIFITNGIVRRPNNLDYVKFASDDTLRYASETSRQLDQKAIAMMPEGKVHNYLFKGSKDYRYEDKSFDWGFGAPNVANGATYADLDNDGDLDLVTNNINEPASIYENQAQKMVGHHYLKIKLEGRKGNRFGIGTKVFVKHQGEMQMQQLMPTRGFLSSVEPILTFGIGETTTVDTIVVIWENMNTEILAGVKVDGTLVVREADASPTHKRYYESLVAKSEPLFENVSDKVPIAYKHEENRYLDFYREPLIPFQVSTEGPKIAVGDVNGDGLDDIYACGAKRQPGKLFIQNMNGQFSATNEKLFRNDSTFEDVDAVFFDADGDKDNDLYVVSGGNEFYGTMPEQFDRLYLNDGKGKFLKSHALPPMFDNKSCVRPCDIDSDGDLDLFVGGRVVGFQYGKSPASYLLINEGKGVDGQPHFVDKTASVGPELKRAGMVTDATWIDYDSDGDFDLTVTGDWMPLRQFENQQGKLHEVNCGFEHTEGLWQTLAAGDFDHDGDIDLLAGNLGTNTKFRKNENSTLRLYVKDIDENQSLDHILAYTVGDKQYPVATKDELDKQLPFLRKRFTRYSEFAGKTIDEIFTKKELSGAQVLSVNRFESVLFENLGDRKFSLHVLPQEAQVSKLYTFDVADIDGDGNLDILAGGNLRGVSMYQGSYDASYGLILKGDGRNHFTAMPPNQSGFLLEGDVRDIKRIKLAKTEAVVVAANGLPLQVFKVLKSK